MSICLFITAHIQGFMQDNIFASHTFGEHMDVKSCLQGSRDMILKLGISSQ